MNCSNLHASRSRLQKLRRHFACRRIARRYAGLPLVQGTIAMRLLESEIE
jgi:hypothetical protein